MKILLPLVLGLLTCPRVPADAPATVVTFGDSTTATRGSLKIYASILQAELPQRQFPVRVINAGIGGNNTDQARARFDRDVLAQNPDIVIIQFGINDSAVDVWKDPPATQPRVSVEAYVSNLQYFVRTLRSNAAQVVLMTPNPMRWTPKMKQLYGKPPYAPDDVNGFNVLLTEYSQGVRDLAKSEKVPLVDVDHLFEEYGRQDGQSVSDLLLDGIHPNDAGHRLVADQLIQQLLKLPPPR